MGGGARLVSAATINAMVAGGAVTQRDFAIALLERLGVHPSSTAIENIIRWEQAEGGNWSNSAAFNPLNTTLRLPGSMVMPGGSSAGVQAYRSWEQGLEATAQTLSGYPGIIAALDAPPATFERAVEASPWGTRFSSTSIGAEPSASASPPRSAGAPSSGEGLGGWLVSTAEHGLLYLVLLAGGAILIFVGLTRGLKARQQ